MYLDDALEILQRVCTNDNSKTALVRIRNSIVEKNRKINELQEINNFLEEYVSGTIPRK